MIIIVILGITGNSGAGKSKISNYLLDLGFSVIDTDKLGHEALNKNTFVYKELIDKFGNTILDESKNINRKKLGSIVFANEKDLEFLSRHSHKYIKHRILEIINFEEEKNSKLIIIDGALLLDAKINEICTENWLVIADYNIRLKRIMDRDKILKEDGEKRLKFQKDYLKSKEKFDLVIDNSKDFAITKNIVLNNINRLIGGI